MVLGTVPTILQVGSGSLQASEGSEIVVGHFLLHSMKPRQGDFITAVWPSGDGLGKVSYSFFVEIFSLNFGGGVSDTYYVQGP